MNSNPANSKGFSIVETIVIVFVVGLVVFAGLFVYTKSQENDTAENTTSQSQENAGSTNDDSAPEVNSTEDLNSAEQFVDEVNVDKSLDTSDIDNTLDN